MLTLNDLTPGTLVALSDGKLAVITGYRTNNPVNPVVFKMAAGQKSYKGSVSQFKAVIGTVELSKFNEACGVSPVIPRMSGFDNDSLVPDSLKGIRIGDKVIIRSRKGSEVVTYGGYNPRRPKFPVSFADASGRQMKGTVGLVVGKA